MIRDLLARWRTYAALRREVYAHPVPQYDAHADEWCLAPGLPLTAAHITIAQSEPHLAIQWPQWLRKQHGVEDVLTPSDDYLAGWS